MAIGTEGNDVLSNDRTLRNETIEALGGDDRINITNSHPALEPHASSTVTVNGGAGTDTLSISSTYISSLSATSAFIHEGRLGPMSLFRYQNPIGVSWTGIERLVVTGIAYPDFNSSGNYAPISWSTGGTSDEIHVLSTFGGVRITIDTGGGDDQIYLGSVGPGSVVYAGAGNDIVDSRGATVGFLTTFGGEGDDILYGNPAGDYMIGGPGADIMAGGDGHDEYVVDDPGDIVVETEGGGFDQIYTSLAVYTLAPNVSNLRLTGDRVDRDLTLNSLSNVVVGDYSNDLFRLQSGGDDYAYGGDGGGDDVFYFGTAYTSMDRVEAGSGTDTVVLQGSYAITLSSSSLNGMDILSLLGGANPQYGDTANNFYSYNITTVDGNVAAGERLTVDAQTLRSGESLTFNGSAETNGSFALYGGAGMDRITGGSGNDLIFGGGGSDTLTGGAGDDLFVYASLAHSPAVGRDRIIGFAPGDRIDLSAIDAVVATSGDDAFTFIGANAFSGTAGELRVDGAGGVWAVSADVNGDGFADFSLVVLTSDARLATGADFLL